MVARCQRIMYFDRFSLFFTKTQIKQIETNRKRHHKTCVALWNVKFEILQLKDLKPIKIRELRQFPSRTLNHQRVSKELYFLKFTAMDLHRRAAPRDKLWRCLLSDCQPERVLHRPDFASFRTTCA